MNKPKPWMTASDMQDELADSDIEAELRALQEHLACAESAETVDDVRANLREAEVTARALLTAIKAVRHEISDRAQIDAATTLRRMAAGEES